MNTIFKRQTASGYPAVGAMVVVVVYALGSGGVLCLLFSFCSFGSYIGMYI